jgi:hypothetical protein
MTQNEVHALFRDDTEGVILFRVTERNETERNDFASCFSNYYRFRHGVSSNPVEGRTNI